MELYKNLYFGLFRKAEEAAILLDDGNVWEAKEALLDGMEEAENKYIEAIEEPPEEVVLTEFLAQIRKALSRMEEEERAELYRQLERRRRQEETV